MVSLFWPARQGWRRFINRLQQRITRTRGSFFCRTCRWPWGNILRRPVDDPKLIFKSVHERFHAPPCEDPPNGRTDGHHCRVLVRPQVSSASSSSSSYDSSDSILPIRDFPPYDPLAEILPQDHCREFFPPFFSPHFFLTKRSLSLVNVRRPTLASDPIITFAAVGLSRCCDRCNSRSHEKVPRRTDASIDHAT